MRVSIPDGGRIQQWQLVDAESGCEIHTGDVRPTRGGESFVVDGGTPPHKPSSTGRVHGHLKFGNHMLEFFPGIIGAEWRRID